MNQEFCFQCQSLQNMNTSQIETNERQEDGKMIKVTTISHHCSVCNAYIKSDVEKTEVIGNSNSEPIAGLS